jgi:hypothetical protein
MSVTRRRIAHTALMASASFLSLTFATEAQAQCVTNNTDPVSNVTTDGTIVTCTGTATGQVVSSNADQVQVVVTGGSTVNGGSVVFATGNQNTVAIRSGAVFDASTIILQGNNGLVAIEGSSTAAGITVQGDSSSLLIAANAVVSIMPTNLAVSASATGSNTIELRGTLIGSSAPGGYLLRGGDGAQQVFVSGTLNVQSDGLAINLLDGDDEVYLEAGAVLTGGTNNNILLNGGAGNDLLWIDDSGLSHFSTVGIETLVVNPGTGGFRGLSGSHADVTRFVAASGTVNLTSLAALGQANSNVLIAGGAQLNLSQAGGGAFNHVLAGSGTLALNFAGSTYTFGGTGSNSYALGTLINDGAVRVDDFARLGTGQVIANAGGSLILNYNGAGQLLQTAPFLTGGGAFIKEGTGLPEAYRRGRGLTSMETRARNLGGALTIATGSDGTCLTLEVPITTPDPSA